ncbi:MOSC N-terminal beta barrel domain-containing protein [Streptomyces sp. 891-h]|uniref:MOSC domain-containing protein n=1 Tax=unclassified Streptomyces TaxID=2593676 RepID=UPI001FAB0B5C|nr:MOSC N-terminal beta barrel domain-containing protein [Streptomyces sp. 891-h]UNZ16334.1 MOSC domain-containing protein [Streptomyces sp. 891-h]
MAEVVELVSYPVKGCAAVPARSAHLGPAGLAHDRSFMVVTPDGVGRTQRRDPQLAVIRPEVTAGTDTDGERLALRAPGRDTLHIEVDLTGERRRVEMLKQPLHGIDQGQEAADWLSDVLGSPSRLVRVPPENGRATDGLTPGTSGFADSSAVHVLSRATLAHLGARLAVRGAAPVPMARFRPNVVVDGWDDEPHAEDRVRLLRIGDAELGFAKLAVRCAVTLVDQGSGAKAGPEPLRTLAAYRRSPEGGVTFGAKFSVLRPGTLSVGDKVEVAAWSAEAPAR